MGAMEVIGGSEDIHMGEQEAKGIIFIIFSLIAFFICLFMGWM